MSTVASAIAPFAKVVKNLKKVVTAQDKARETATYEQTSARETYERVVASTEHRKGVAEAEKAKAEKILAKLEALLADDA